MAIITIYTPAAYGSDIEIDDLFSADGGNTSIMDKDTTVYGLTRKDIVGGKRNYRYESRIIPPSTWRPIVDYIESRPGVTETVGFDDLNGKLQCTVNISYTRHQAMINGTFYNNARKITLEFEEV